jgi:hypothetical protein
MEQRALAGARRPGDGERLARRKLQGDPLEHGDRLGRGLVPLVDITQDEGHCASSIRLAMKSGMGIARTPFGSFSTQQTDVIFPSAILVSPRVTSKP